MSCTDNAGIVVTGACPEDGQASKVCNGLIDKVCTAGKSKEGLGSELLIVY